jgi:microcompartment protein CcmK/EutM
LPFESVDVVDDVGEKDPVAVLVLAADAVGAAVADVVIVLVSGESCSVSPGSASSAAKACL